MGFHFVFELKRLNFNINFGYIQDLSDDQREMLISIYLFIRILIGQVLCSPKDYILDKFAKNKQLINNLKTI